MVAIARNDSVGCEYMLIRSLAFKTDFVGIKQFKYYDTAKLTTNIHVEVRSEESDLLSLLKCGGKSR